MNDLEDFSTFIVQEIGSKEGAISPIIVNSASFSYGDSFVAEDIFEGNVAKPLYSRVGNPTTEKLENILTKMEGGIASIATSSGMGAISLAALSLLESGDEVICIGGLFGGSYSFFKESIIRFGIKSHFLKADETNKIKGLINNKTKIIYFESIGNPNMRIVDIDKIVEIADEHDVATMIDNTSTPLTLRAFSMGIDIILYSTTKIISGNSSALGGIAIFRAIKEENDKFKSKRYKNIHKFIEKKGKFALFANAKKKVLRDFGMSASAFNSYLTLIGLETLPLRTKRVFDSTKKIVKALYENGLKVKYPVLENHPDCKLYKKYFTKGCGPVFTIDLGSKKRAFEFIDKLKLAFITANICDSRTLALHMDSTIFSDFTEKEKEFLGITKGLVRVSIGLENPGDLIADFLQP